MQQKKLYKNAIALVRKTQDATEKISKPSTKRDKSQFLKDILSNEETIHDNSAVTIYRLEEDIGKFLMT